MTRGTRGSRILKEWEHDGARRVSADQGDALGEAITVDIGLRGEEGCSIDFCHLYKQGGDQDRISLTSGNKVPMRREAAGDQRIDGRGTGPTEEIMRDERKAEYIPTYQFREQEQAGLVK